MDLRKKQVADRRDRLVAFEAHVLAAFKMIEPQLRLLILKTTLDVPAREADQQQRLERGLGRCVADEILDLGRLQHIAGDH